MKPDTCIRMRSWRAALLASACVCAPLGAADYAASAASTTDAALAPPQVRERGEVRYVTGGVGIEGRRELARRGEGMNLHLVFAEPQTGALHAKFDVSIADRHGRELLKVKDADPMLFADLAPGTYSIKASHADGTVQREVTVPNAGLRREILFWG